MTDDWPKLTGKSELEMFAEMLRTSCSSLPDESAVKAMFVAIANTATKTGELYRLYREKGLTTR